MNTKRLFALSGAVALLGLPVATGVQASQPTAGAIDAVFESYDGTTTPGCALGVIQDGELVYKRGYGMANLEYGIALSSTSVFRTGSVGKQFTAMAIAILAEQGTIALDEPLSEFFPEFPSWADSITIRHLVHHTSGIRDYLTLTWLAGMGDDEFYTDEFALDLLARQQHLNFPPGDEYLYSNSGYLLLAHIVKRATGQTLREWAAQHLFGPLGMRHTHYHDDHTHIVPNRASGYAPTDAGYRISMTTLDMVGDGGVFTTVEDLLLWDRNFYDNKLGQGGPGLIETVTTPGRFNSGEPMDYAFGLRIADYRGLHTVSHGGAFVGFRAHTLRFPDQRFSAYVLCNRADAEPGIFAERVAELYLGDLMAPAPAVEAADAGAVVQLSATDLERLAGHYWSAGDREFLEIELVGDFLQVSPNPGESWVLEPRSAEHLLLSTPWRETDLRFTETDDGARQMTSQVRGQDEQRIYEKFVPRQLDASELEAYLGTYYSQELDVDYVIAATDEGSLTFAIGRRGEHPLEAGFGEVFHNSEYGLFTFQRGDDGAVAGFMLDSGRIRDLEFVRRQQQPSP